MTQLLTTPSPLQKGSSRKLGSPLVVILLGPPGSGKGTHAGPLGLFLQVPHISTGDLFRENIRLKTPMGTTAATYINAGKLVPDAIVLDMLFARTSQPDCQNGYILDGFPRTVAQAQALDQKIGQQFEVVVLNLRISDELLTERITGRIGCGRCGAPFHKTYNPPQQTGLCDGCGGPLSQREDDTAEILQKRLEAYRTLTEPLIGYYAEKKETLQNVDAQGAKFEVYLGLTRALEASTKALQSPSKCQC